jgi:outer membrane protein assembly factor BamB
MMIRRLIPFTFAALGALPMCLDNCRAAPGDLLFKLTAPDPQPGAGFGDVLTIVDGNLLVGETTRTLGPAIDATGRAYLFDGQTGQLKQTFDNPEPMRNDFFGSSLAGGDGRVFISARGVPDRVYAFATQTGEHLHTIHQPSQFHNSFAATIAYGNGSVLVSSAAFSIPFGPQSIGQSELFDAATGELHLSLPNPAPKSGDVFGLGGSAVFGNRAIVGAELDDYPDDTTTEGRNAGRVWVFDRVSGDTLFTLENPNRQKLPPNFFNDEFGASIAANEQFIVVGAEQEDVHGISNSGAVYVFDFNTGTLLHTLVSPNIEERAFFGHEVAVTASGRIFVAANSASVEGHADAGRVFLFDGLTGSLLLDISNPQPEQLAGFGFSIAATDERLFVGTPSFGERVFVFETIPEPSSVALLVVAIGIIGSVGVAKYRKR